MNPAASDIKIDSPSPQVASQDVERYYQFLEPAFAVGGFEYEPEELDQDLLSGQVLLIRVWNGDELQGLAALKVRHTKVGLDLYCLALVGEELSLWADAFREVVFKLANEMDAQSISLQGRPGFGKYLKGFKVHQCIYQKKLRSNGNGRW